MSVPIIGFLKHPMPLFSSTIKQINWIAALPWNVQWARLLHLMRSFASGLLKCIVKSNPFHTFSAKNLKCSWECWCCRYYLHAFSQWESFPTLDRLFPASTGSLALNVTAQPSFQAILKVIMNTEQTLFFFYWNGTFTCQCSSMDLFVQVISVLNVDIFKSFHFHK